MKILIATQKPFAKVASEQMKQILEESKFNTELLENYTSQKELYNAAKEADALIVRSDIVNRKVIESAPNLKIVVRAGAGYDNI